MQNLKYKKVILAFIAFMLVSNVQIASAGVAEAGILSAILGKDIAKFVKDTTDQVSNYIKITTTAVNTGKTVINTAKNLKNFDLSNVAKNLTSDKIINLGTAVLENTGSTKMPGINSFTNGAQIITDLGNYLDKTSINEIRKTLNDLKDPINTNPYTAEIQKSITSLVRNTADESAGKLINFTLPYIAQKEICESEELKDVIENGEPENYIKPKPAVDNVDIKESCEINLSDSEEGEKGQAIFIALAKSGYAGQNTKMALADPANTPSGVIGGVISKMEDAKNKAVEIASKQAESTGLVIGNQTCLNEDGEEVDFDSTNPNEAFCDSQQSDTTNSAVLAKEKINAAAQSPYIAFLSKADATQKSGNEFLDTVSNIANVLDSILGLGMGGGDFENAISGSDNPYTELANSLSGLKETMRKEADLGDSAEEANREYELGETKKIYTTADLQEANNLYTELREFNIRKLNIYAFTYILLKQAVYSSSGFRNLYVSNPVGGILYTDPSLNLEDPNAFEFIGRIENLPRSISQLNTCFDNITKSMQTLIKEMAQNNYKEQEIKNFISKLNTSKLEKEEISLAIENILKGAITQKEYAEKQIDWEYVPEYQNEINDPTSDEQEKVLNFTRDEVTGPFTVANLFNIRVRAYKTLWAFKITPFDERVLKGYGITSIDQISPNMPRASQAPNLISAEDSKKYSELAFCNKLDINICSTLQRR